mmetsp:Transcript_41441/g.132368  ORF Transcript_41441/g.132368 Transcript_41441/m.132368 type:complete len:215 (+) Transcript_41441:376-1020(+)
MSSPTRRVPSRQGSLPPPPCAPPLLSSCARLSTLSSAPTTPCGSTISWRTWATKSRSSFSQRTPTRAAWPRLSRWRWTRSSTTSTMTSARRSRPSCRRCGEGRGRCSSPQFTCGNTTTACSTSTPWSRRRPSPGWCTCWATSSRSHTGGSRRWTRSSRPRWTWCARCAMGRWGQACAGPSAPTGTWRWPRGWPGSRARGRPSSSPWRRTRAWGP